MGNQKGRSTSVGEQVCHWDHLHWSELIVVNEVHRKKKRSPVQDDGEVDYSSELLIFLKFFHFLEGGVQAVAWKDRIELGNNVIEQKQGTPWKPQEEHHGEYHDHREWCHEVQIGRVYTLAVLPESLQ